MGGHVRRRYAVRLPGDKTVSTSVFYHGRCSAATARKGSFGGRERTARQSRPKCPLFDARGAAGKPAK